MTRKQKNLLLRIILAAAMMAALHFVPVQGLTKFALYLIPYLTIGSALLKKAFRGICRGQVFDENFLMAVATIGALALGFAYTGDYAEAVAVMLFFQIGELFESCAVGKSRQSIGALMDIRPDHANIEENGQLCPIDPEEVAVGTLIVVQPGEKIPIDGIVIEGSSALDTAALTGESLPREVGVGSEVVSGCISLTGLLKIRTTRPFGESTVSKILDLVENASSRKSRSEHFIAKFAKYYTPAVCISALILAVVPPLLAGQWNVWLYRGLSFLVASCPCALVISIPLTFFAGIGGASREGILVKGSNFLEALSDTGTVVLDKTGTLTTGQFQVSGIYPVELSCQALLELAALAESASNHPISAGLRRELAITQDLSRVSDIQELGGHGVTALVDGKPIAVGSHKLMARLGIECPASGDGTVVHVAIDGCYAGRIELADTLKAGAKEAVSALHGAGVKNTVMLTGDRSSAAEPIARELGMSRFHSELLPDDKVRILEDLLGGSGKVAFAGDGINDAPVLARSDIGIAMGALGSDAAIEAADVVLMDDDPRKIAKAIRIAKKCMAIVWQNIVFAIGVKVLALVLVAVGRADMWLAIFADVGVMVLAVLNALRALNVRRV